jgi:DNA invertase Pin-like site-specific DNA recombinase
MVQTLFGRNYGVSYVFRRYPRPEILLVGQGSRPVPLLKELLGRIRSRYVCPAAIRALNQRQILDIQARIEREFVVAGEKLRERSRSSSNIAAPNAAAGGGAGGVAKPKKKGGRKPDPKIQERDEKMIAAYKKKADHNALSARFDVSIDTAKKVISKARKAGKLPPIPSKNSRQS